MKRSLLDNLSKAVVADYVDSIAIPQYRAGTVESRRGYVCVERRAWRHVWVAIPAAVAAVVLVAFAPAVVAQVQRVMQAFTVVNGRTTQVPVQEVSLAQLRADMPFDVVAPASIPANYHEEIEEVGAGSSDAQAMFHYSAAAGPPVITILENSAQNSSPESHMRMFYSTRGAAMLPRNGTRTFFVKMTPITWIAHGTRITLIAVPGTLDRLQLNAILRAMRT